MKLSIRVLGVGLLTLGLLTLLALAAPAHERRHQSVAERIAELAVTVKAGNSEGSGLLVPGKNGDGYVLTVAHVVRSAKSEKDGFDAVKVFQVINDQGDEVARHELLADVVSYDAEADLALLKLKRPLARTAAFWRDKHPPRLGDKLYACGSILGRNFEQSLTAGVLSRHSRKFKGRVYDQTDCTTFPGSSGSGVFLQKDGRCIGLVYGGAGEGCTLFIAARTIAAWAKENKCDFILGADCCCGCDQPCGCPDCPCSPGGCQCNALKSTRTSWHEPLPLPKAASSL